MAEPGFFRAACRIAWRDARASSLKFGFVVAAVAVGVGCLSGVRGFSESFRAMLLRDARKLMAADLTVRTFSLPTPAQTQAMESLEKRGAARSWITETVSMLSAPGTPDPLLVSLKAVDPAVYPFYGELRLDPPMPLARALAPATIAVSEDLLLRLNIALNTEVTLGGQPFRISAIVASEPDRMSGSLNVGPRVLMSRAALDRTGLLVPGSRAAQRWLFRLPPGAVPVATAREELNAAFPEARIADFRETHPLITRGLDRSTTFLSLVSLIALITGALGVAMAMHSHLQQKLDTIAVMKALGARSSQVLRIYLIETLGMGALGGILGVLLGLGAQRVFPRLIAQYFQIDPGLRFDPYSAFQGLAAGLLTTLLFTLPPLVGVRRVKPLAIFRRDMEEARPPWRARLRESRAALAASVLLAAGMAGIAWWLSDSYRTGLYFLGGVLASLGALGLIAWLLLRGLRGALARAPFRAPATVRQGIANLYRPGNQAAALLVALGLGVTFTLSVYLVQTSMLRQIAASAPPGMPNVFLINITARERDGVQQILSRHAAAGTRPELIPIVTARLESVNGQPIESLQLKGFGRRFQQSRSVSFAASLPAQAEVVEGRWWRATDTAAARGVLLSVSEDTRKTLNVKVGDRLAFRSANRLIQATLAAVHQSEAVRLGAALDFLFIPGALDNLPTLYFAALRLVPDRVVHLQKECYQRYPTVTVINGADVLAIVQEVVDQIALVIRFVSAFAILGGLIILASSVAGTRFRRIRETVILKTLGATRRQVAAIFSIEFLVLGGVAGLIGAALATGFSFLVLDRLFQVRYEFAPLPVVVAVVGTALVANAAGWTASFRILSQKPLEVLRHE